MAKISRQRGANYEREVSNEIFEMLGVRIKRNLKQYQEKDEGDLILGNFLIECKRRRAIAVYEWMEQADKACAPWETPVVVFRADGKKSMAMMHLPDLLKLLGNELPPLDQKQESSLGDS